ncbi:MAG: Nif3-like dinuclear metal center hexameric protein [Christensenellaceae bacterium]|nr:Nif3-like dinuclear metal center hexameric protein [Christensenellaceae bacterium]
MKLHLLMAVLEAIAPQELTEPWDNSGLLCGDPQAEIKRALCCLDATAGVLKKAEESGAELIIAHHPLIFEGLKTLREDRYEGALLARLIRGRRALYAMHTNLDRAPGGVNDCLAEACGLQSAAGSGFLRLGEIAPQSAEAYLGLLRAALGGEIAFYGDPGAALQRVAVSSGAGGEGYLEALRGGAQAFVTGEMRHHEILRALGAGLQVYLAGHFHSERVALPALAAEIARRTGIEALPCMGEEYLT